MMHIGYKIELFVADLDVSVDFYRRVLLFEAGPERSTVLAGKKLRHTPVWKGTTMIGLGLLDRLADDHHLRRGGLDAPKGLGFELCLYVENPELDAFYEHVKQTATTTVEPLVEQPWDARDFRVIDPDGYYIRFSSPDRDFRRLQLIES